MTDLQPHSLTTASEADCAPAFGALIIGDEILSGKRADKHLSKLIELLGARGLALAWAEYVGDDPVRLTAALRRAFASNEVVFATGGIGATPDDHTRQCAAAALGVPLQAHPEAQQLIQARLAQLARERNQDYLPAHPDNLQRLRMGELPQGASLIPNPYNQIPGFSCSTRTGALVHFVPGFPVMAWPMFEWVLEQHYARWFATGAWQERSCILPGAMEASLTPLMLALEQQHPAIKVFSLPSVDHPQYGRHLELGVKGPSAAVAPAYAALQAGLHALGMEIGPELVRER